MRVQIPGRPASSSPTVAAAVLGVVAVAGAFVISQGLATLSFDVVVIGVAAAALFAIVFIRTDVGLYVVIFSMMLSPEFAIGGKALAERREVVVRLEDLTLVVIALAWLAKTAVNKEVGLVARTPLNRPILAYIAAHLFTTLFGMVTGTVHTGAGLFYVLKYVEYFFVYYMVANNLTTREQAWRLVGAAFLTAAIASLYGLAQIPSGRRVSAPFEGEVGEPNSFGGYLLIMMAVAAGLALETRSTRIRMALGGLVGLMFLPFLYTLSRASYLALIPTALTLIAIFPRRRWPVVAVLAVALAFLALAPPESVAKRVRYTFTPERGRSTIQIAGTRFDPSTNQRFENWLDAAEAWTEHPLLGHGVTGFRFLDAQYPRTLVETGLVGMAAFVWMVAALLRATYRRFLTATDAGLRGLAGGFLAALIGILAHAFGSNSFIIIRIMEPFWFFAAVVLMMPAAEPGETMAPPRRPTRLTVT
jgi:O-antigen ligase